MKPLFHDDDLIYFSTLFDHEPEALLDAGFHLDPEDPNPFPGADLTVSPEEKTLATGNQKWTVVPRSFRHLRL